MSSGRHITAAMRRRVVTMRTTNGMTEKETARRMHIHERTVRRIMAGLRNANTSGAQMERESARDPVALDALSPNAARGLEDFGFFFSHYLGPKIPRWDGTVPAYWSEMTGEISSGHHDHLLINIHPGAGKTTALYGYIVWKITQNRDTKVAYISKSEKLAKRAITWIAWHFENNERLIADYGRFKPDNAQTWTKTDLVVEGADLLTKEATLSVYGAAASILGVRVELIVADDVVDISNSGTPEQRDRLADWFHTEVETRLEPGGVIAVVGSRLSAFDLYAELHGYRDPDTEQRLYHRILYPAHEASLCPGDGTHPAYPNGCLLWPMRWSYEELMRKRLTQGPRFDVMYQQRDVAPGESLARREWIYGGADAETGDKLPGCLDHDRILGGYPDTFDVKDGKAHAFRTTSVITIDPSPSQWWAIEWWLVSADGRWWLIDLIRRKMPITALLDGDPDYPTGILEDLARRAREDRHPLSTVIVESNASQKWFAQTRLAQEWARQWGIRFLSHMTTGNKGDPKLGVWALGARFRAGKIHIPYGDERTRTLVAPFIDEALVYPHGQTDDTVMAAWFLLWNEGQVMPRPLTNAPDGRGVPPVGRFAPPPRMEVAGRAQLAGEVQKPTDGMRTLQGAGLPW